ncbi:rho GTPase-activating protein 29-like isoform X2 [Denticeps clupeoides]|uniref:rho GTPase-activating protein 29-like isoform X2 n=1 Tax=Denticeps clupeoides TaxID=299321 RepID=UPI0010A2C838|nr:rho GTPase-activating protein 29-like isoform X2 [Denticeps clupeoides]
MLGQVDVGSMEGRVHMLHPSSSRTWNRACDPHGHDPEYIIQLVTDLRQFADVLQTLRETLQRNEYESSAPLAAQEQLGELVRLLKLIIDKHPTLNSADILSAAGKVISKVKGLNCAEVNSENKGPIFGELYTAIDTLAFTFGDVVSDFLMGDVDASSRLGVSSLHRRSVSFENVSGEHGPEGGDMTGPASSPLLEELDVTLLSDNGVESALLYAKSWSKYTKELLAWVDKRLSLDIECAKSIAKNAESAKALANQEEYMPFKDIYMSAFKNDMEYSQLLLQKATALQTNKFMQPLLTRRNELDKLRKDLKDLWHREQKKMHEADAAERKVRILQTQRKEMYEKARSSTTRSEKDEQSTSGVRQLEKRRRLEEEALQKAEEAQDQLRLCVGETGARRSEMISTKNHILTQIHEHLLQCDLTLKAVTVNWFQMQQALSQPLNYQNLCDTAKRYEPGQRYADFIRSLQKGYPQNKTVQNLPRVPENGGQGRSSSRDELDSTTWRSDELRSDSQSEHTGVQGGGVCSDSESAGASSESRSMDSPTTSPGGFSRRLTRTPSTGTMSSADDLDDREPPSPLCNDLGEMMTEMASSPGPFRNAQMSRAAHTHKLRKLRAPSKCRECDSLVVFHGAECEECSLACHKKCLETLAIQCGHRKLQGRLQLFGVDFAQAARDSPDFIPFIIKKCTSEIESRALNLKGIYRVNGAKSRVEKLCQAFENGKELVELSDHSPHDISNVLKLYLRQLPEPLILYRYYNDIIGLAKETQGIMVELESEEVTRHVESTADRQQSLKVELDRIILRMGDILGQLPNANFKSLQFLLAHLKRISDNAEENKMTASNLGIIFGPTLVKPRQAQTQVSLSSLVDYPYQALVVELLICHQRSVFPAQPDTMMLSSGHQDQRLMSNSQSPTEQDEGIPASSSPSQELHEAVEEGSLEVESGRKLNGLEALGPVQLRATQRLLSRPVSLPVEGPLLLASVPLGLPGLPEAAESGGPRPRPASTFLDTQTLRRTWDRQYRHYSVTPRTSIIVTNLPWPPTSAESPHSTQSGVSAIFPNSPYVATVRQRQSAKTYEGLPIAFRAPRTLQPPPGTFYTPPTGRRDCLLTDLGRSVTTEAAIPARKGSEEERDSPAPPSIPRPVSPAITPSTSQTTPPQTTSPSASSANCPAETNVSPQGIRSHQMSEVEDQETHFV